MDDLSDRLKRELAYNLIFGMLENVREVWEAASRAGLKNPPNFATVWEVHDCRAFHDRSELWKINWRRKAAESFAGCFDCPALHCFVSDRALAVLFNSREWGEPIDGNGRLKVLKDQVEGKLAVKFLVGVGRVYPDARHLGLSFNEAREAIRRTVSSAPEIYYFGDAAMPREEVFLEREKAALRRAVLQDDSLDALRTVEEITEKLAVFDGGGPNTLKVIIFEMLSQVIAACLENGRRAEEIFISARDWMQQLHLAGDTKRLVQIWSDACRKVLLDTDKDHNLDGQVVTRAKRFLDEHLHEDLSLTEIARRQFISPFYFSRLFKQSTGMTVMEYLACRRMEKAKELLEKTHQSISQVAAAVGYADPNYFSRVFRRHAGMSPSEYRRRYHS